MIISHEHEFIFLKTAKTAGTSIEVYLAGIAGYDAVVTPAIPPEVGHAPRNWQQWFNPTRELIGSASLAPSTRRSNVRTVVSQFLTRKAYHEHMTANRVRRRLGMRRWNRYYKFSFVRNPWDRAISRYWFRTGGDPHRPSFDEYTCRAPLIRPTWPVYALGDRVAADFVGRFESLLTDLAAVAAVLGLPAPDQLPRAKGGFRPADASVKMTRNTHDLIAEIHHKEIDYFGYECPPEFLAEPTDSDH